MFIKNHFGIFSFKWDLISGIYRICYKLPIVCSADFRWLFFNWFLLLRIWRCVILTKCLINILRSDNKGTICWLKWPILFIYNRLPIIKFLIHNGIKEPDHFEERNRFCLEYKNKQLILLTIINFYIVIIIISISLNNLIFLPHNIKKVAFSLT